MKTYLLLILCFMFLWACEKQGPMLFKDKHEIYFNKFYTNELYPGTEQADSTTFSLFFYPVSLTAIEVPVVVNLSGTLLSSDLRFQLRVVAEETTAVPEEYTLDEYYVFHANNVTEDATEMLDTIGIKFHRSDRLSSMPEGVKLVVELIPNDEVGLGQIERTRAKIIVTNMTVKPDWWNDEVEFYLFGKYSQEKYRTFLDNVPGANKLDGNLIKNRPDEARKLALQFKKWLSEQNPPVKEKNGSLMVVTV